jgi:putative nucleotidyltransferase with HDIG domain
MVLLLGGAAAALSVRVVRRRAQGLYLGVVIAVVYAVTAVVLGLMGNREAGEILNGVLWGSVNGVASSLLAMGFMPLFESFTRITTDQTLLELADLNRPILKRLSLEASGTYAHSINVANLAEAAARAIDANPLLARVGAYYHDIGKIAMPQYFIENQARGRNPHDQLDPLRSASIVRQHVLEGMKLAEQARLPACVARFIPEHHGTQPIGFFYEQARQAAPEAEIDPAPYSYQDRSRRPGTVILMLADSVESAARCCQATAARIRGLVETHRGSQAGELGPGSMMRRSRCRRCPRQDQFVAVLSGSYHHRIDYPTAPLLPRNRSPPAVPPRSRWGCACTSRQLPARAPRWATRPCRALLRRGARAVLRAHGVGDGELSLTLLGAAEIAALHQQYLRHRCHRCDLVRSSSHPIGPGRCHHRRVPEPRPRRRPAVSARPGAAAPDRAAPACSATITAGTGRTRSRMAAAGADHYGGAGIVKRSSWRRSLKRHLIASLIVIAPLTATI